MPVTTKPNYLPPAIATALVSTLIGLFLTCSFTLFGWLGDRSVGFSGVLSGGVRTWLVSHGSALTANGVSVTAIPLGATLCALFIVLRVTITVLDEPIEEVGAFVAIVAGTTGVLAGLLSLVTSSPDYSTSLARSAIGGFCVAGAGAAIGTAIKARQAEGLWPTDSADVRSVVTAAGHGLFALVAPAFAIVIALLALHIGRAGDLWASLGPGFFGSIGLAGLCLAVIPNLVLWTVAVLLGPGFALGTSTSVDLTGAHLGAVPGLPVLAGLPAPGEFPGWVFLLGLIPLLAGIYAGWRLRIDTERSLTDRVLLGAGAGAVAGLIVGILIGLSGGSIGPGRMATTGPSAESATLVAIGVLALGGAIGAALGHYRVTRAHNSPTGRSHLWRRHQSASAD